MWECKKCKEENDENCDVCWKCGSDKKEERIEKSYKLEGKQAISKMIENQEKIRNIGLGAQGVLERFEKHRLGASAIENITRNQNKLRDIALSVQSATRGLESIGVEASVVGNIIKNQNRIRDMVLGFQGIAERFEHLGLGASAIENITRNQNKLRDIALSVQSATRGLETLGVAFQPLKSVMTEKLAEINELNFEDVDIDRNGTMTYTGEIMDLNDTVQRVSYFLEEDISIQERIMRVVNCFKKAHPLVCFMIIFFMYSPIQCAYNNSVYNLINQTIGEHRLIESNNIMMQKKAIKKEVKKEIHNRVDDEELKKEILKDYRFVSADCLNVRMKGTKKSRVIYKLHVGQPVRIINKQKNWTQIEYKSEDGNVYVKGWVFTRYIKRFD
ncbi:SH3 domain-containing protein [Crassaminicella profunda]|uniref:SH3 domain-containing protein n=1 Tax=Crassaminicella profunda TaxID=1286698 RepID=UPI001CA680E5|nr:SH3 domain-containing protein [Crassaminicella profunda]QZY56655.1 SH3 domain-containing protein [Crassaminicella profunda]